MCPCSAAVAAQDARAVLSSTLGMDDRQCNLLISATRAFSDAGDGTIDTRILAEYTFDGLLQLAELDIVREAAGLGTST